MRIPAIFPVIAALLLTSCFGGSGKTDMRSEMNATPPAPPTRVRTILAMGDSLTAGYQLPPESSYPSQLEGLLTASGYGYRVSNAGVSGDTSAALLARTDWLLADPLPDLAIVSIGSNDGLQGKPIGQMDGNIREILAKLRSKGVKTALIGVKIPRNLGPEYVSDFERTFPKIAEENDIPFLPFLLE